MSAGAAGAGVGDERFDESTKAAEPEMIAFGARRRLEETDHRGNLGGKILHGVEEISDEKFCQSVGGDSSGRCSGRERVREEEACDGTRASSSCTHSGGHDSDTAATTAAAPRQHQPTARRPRTRSSRRRASMI